jgi:hypothetical protein
MGPRYHGMALRHEANLSQPSSVESNTHDTAEAGRRAANSE